MPSFKDARAFAWRRRNRGSRDGTRCCFLGFRLFYALSFPSYSVLLLHHSQHRNSSSIVAQPCPTRISILRLRVESLQCASAASFQASASCERSTMNTTLTSRLPILGLSRFLPRVNMFTTRIARCNAMTRGSFRTLSIQFHLHENHDAIYSQARNTRSKLRILRLA